MNSERTNNNNLVDTVCLLAYLLVYPLQHIHSSAFSQICPVLLCVAS